jgi:transcription antitermination factor NusG
MTPTGSSGTDAALFPPFEDGCASYALPWYVIQFAPSPPGAPRYDTLILRWLAWLGLEKYQFTYREKSERRQTFPGYLFVSFDVELGRWRHIPQIPGVVKLLCSGTQENPIALPPGLFEAMIADHSVRRVTAPKRFFEILARGSEVEISTGPFAGHRGLVENSDERIVSAFVTLFGQRSVMKINRDNVRRVA